MKINNKGVLIFLMAIITSSSYAQYNNDGNYIEIVSYKNYKQTGPAYKIGYNDSSKSYIDTFDYKIYDNHWLMYQLHRSRESYKETILTKNKDSVIIFEYANNTNVNK